MTKKKAFKIVLVALMLWLAVFVVDLLAVASFGHEPVFCIESKNDSHYVGLGYSFDCCTHPISEQFEYSLSVFGAEVTSTFTNQPLYSHISRNTQLSGVPFLFKTQGNK